MCFHLEEESAFLSTSGGQAAGGCWEIKQIAGCCNSKPRLGALTHIGQMLAGRWGPEACPQEELRSCFPLVRASAPPSPWPQPQLRLGRPPGPWPGQHTAALASLPRKQPGGGFEGGATPVFKTVSDAGVCRAPDTLGRGPQTLLQEVGPSASFCS